MSSPQGEAFTEAAAKSRRLSQEAYGIALPALGAEYAAINQALASGGEPEYLRRAQRGARAGITEGMARGGLADLRTGAAGEKYAIQSGNVGLVTPQVLGGQLAQALYGPRVSEAMSGIEQLDKLLGSGIGQSQQTGSAALRATGTELADIGMMRNYNQGYAGVLAALNAGGSIYGAYGQRQAAQQAGGTGLGALGPWGVPYGPGGGAWNVGGTSGVGYT